MLHRGAWWLPGKPYRTHSLHTAHNPPQHWVAVKKALLDLGVLVCLFFSLAALFSSGDKSVMMPLLFDSVAGEAARGPAWPWKCRASFSGDSKSTGELNAHTRHYLLFIKTDRVVYNKLVCLSPLTTGWAQTTCPSNQERRFRRVSSPTGSSSTDGDGRTQKSFLLEPLNFIKLSVGTRASTHDQGGSSWSAFLSGLTGDPSQIDLRGSCLYPQFLGVCKWTQTTRKTTFLSAFLMSRLYEQGWVWTLPSSHARGTSQNKQAISGKRESEGFVLSVWESSYASATGSSWVDDGRIWNPFVPSALRQRRKDSAPPCSSWAGARLSSGICTPTCASVPYGSQFLLSSFSGPSCPLEVPWAQVLTVPLVSKVSDATIPQNIYLASKSHFLCLNVTLSHTNSESTYHMMGPALLQLHMIWRQRLRHFQYPVAHRGQSWRRSTCRNEAKRLCPLEMGGGRKQLRRPTELSLSVGCSSLSCTWRCTNANSHALPRCCSHSPEAHGWEGSSASFRNQ